MYIHVLISLVHSGSHGPVSFPSGPRASSVAIAPKFSSSQDGGEASGPCGWQATEASKKTSTHKHSSYRDIM